MMMNTMIKCWFVLHLVVPIRGHLRTKSTYPDDTTGGWGGIGVNSIGNSNGTVVIGNATGSRLLNSTRYLQVEDPFEQFSVSDSKSTEELRHRRRWRKTIPRSNNSQCPERVTILNEVISNGEPL